MAKARKQRPESTTSARADLSTIPAAALQAELQRRKRRVAILVRRLEKLVAQADALRSEIDALGGALAAKAAPQRTRARSGGKLVEALAAALAGRTMSVGDAMKAALESGYRSASPQFRKIVNITLAQSSRFRRVGRGLYTAN